MKRFTTVAALAASLQTVSAHYIFSNLIVDGNYTGTYEYVRKNTNNNSPLTDVTSTGFRCNTGAQDSAATTSTYTVAAGATVGMGVGFGGSVIHPGPLLVYLSKAPDGTSASAYDGSGDWFKIHELGTSVINSTGMFWETTDKANFTWTLPADTPPGEYLMRTEHIALHQAESAGGAQFYMECAQLSVTGGSPSATPSPTAQIPGVYSATDPGIEINIYYPIPQSYDFPGPAVWPAGADSAGSGNSTAASTGAAGTTGASSAVAASSKASTAAVSAFSHFANSTATSTLAVKATSVVAGSAPVSSEASGSGSSSSGSDTGSESGAAAPAVTSFAAATAGSSSSSGSGSAGGQALYAQCGGTGWTGNTACAEGSCVSQNPFYYQCISTAGGADKVATSVAAVAQVTSAAAAEVQASTVVVGSSEAAATAVATTFVTSKKKCSGRPKTAKTAAATGGVRPAGAALPTGGYARPSGSGAGAAGFSAGSGRASGTGRGSRPMISAL